MKSSPPKLNAEDKAWRARSDAEALARAHEITSDRSRHSAACAHAKKEALKFSTVAAKGKKK